MKSRRYRQLIKNPIVRLLRPIFRFFYRLFNPRRPQVRARPDRPTDPDLSSVPVAPTIEIPVVKRPPTLGEVLDRIDWQFTQGLPVNPTKLKSSSTNVVANRDNSNPQSPTAAATGSDLRYAIPTNSIKPAANTTRLDLTDRKSARTMTVGELFESVRWQHRPIAADLPNRPPANFDPSRN